MDSNLHNNLPRGPVEKPDQYRLVWDLPLRLFHWFIVIAVSVAGITGFLAPSWWLDTHVVAGYAIGILLVFRIAWGFVGSHYSKFRQFPMAISGMLRHLRMITTGKSDDHAGHNPLGSWMIAILISTLTGLVLSGLVALAGQEKLGPLAFLTTYQVGHLAKEIHEFIAFVLLGAIFLHLTGVFAEIYIFRHPVLKAMFTGKKPMANLSPGMKTSAYIGRGALVFVVFGVLLIGVGASLAGKPPMGWRAVDVPADYKSECGDCHVVYHPGLRSKEAWQSIMAGLADHYGEDASLDEASVASISSYLEKNDAGTFDTKAANQMGKVNTPTFRITETRRWKRKHRKIEPSVFRLKSVGSKINCNACHEDASTGLFNDSNVNLPNGAQE